MGDTGKETLAAEKSRSGKPESMMKIHEEASSKSAIPDAKTRIAGGIAFEVKARRLTMNENLEYLIDWDGNTFFHV